MKIVVALGGNALVEPGEAPSPESQRRRLSAAARAMAPLARENSLVVTHGNGPQVGLLALQADAYSRGTDTASWPLDILGAESEGMLGYLIEEALQSVLPARQIVSLLTRVEVASDDPAFLAPSKPIGPEYDELTAKKLAYERGWTFAPVGPGSKRWRRRVASPEPRRVLESHAIDLLISAGAIVVCAGGGGIPVATAPTGELRGLEAVVDKDLASALLASTLRADVLLLLTNVDAAYRDWDTRRAEPIGEASFVALRALSFAPGSMQPKVEAACRFVESGGRLAAIGRLENADALLAGRCGTRVVNSGVPALLR